MNKLKKSFDKTSNERSEKVEKQINDYTKKQNTGNEETNSQVQFLVKSNEIDKNKQDRAKRNIFEMSIMNNMNKEEKQKRRMEDLAMTTLELRNTLNKNEVISIPFEYKLSQNYPNPFNPVTTINFSIPKQGNVTLKVYDVTGKEVKTLINEQRVVGKYSISFDGSNLSSGA